MTEEEGKRKERTPSLRDLAAEGKLTGQTPHTLGTTVVEMAHARVL